MAAAGVASRVLVVDDDPTVRDVLRRYLRRAGHEVYEAADGEAALAAAAAHRPDLVVLDVMLPGPDGLEVCRLLHERSAVPVIMLSALDSESDRVVGLEHGADDYVVKPFSPRELTLRVERVLGRASTAVPAEPGRPHQVVDGDLELDLRARTVHRSGVPLSLTLREFDLLAFLLTHPDQVFTRTELMEQVWHWSFGDESTVTVHVRRLRRKVELDPSAPVRLLTAWGVGYRWMAAPAQRDPGVRR